MAPQVQLVTYGTVGTRRVTADASYVTFEVERVAVDGGNILESSITYQTPGLLKSMLSWQFNVSAAVEKFVLSRLLAAPSAFVNEPSQLQLDPGTPGSTAYMLRAGFREFKRSGAHGELIQYDAVQDLVDKRPFIGATLINTVLAGVPITAPVTTTPVEFDPILAEDPGVAPGYVAYFLAAVGGDPDGISGTLPTFAAKLQSATDEAFTTPVDRGTFTGLTTTPGVQEFEFDGDVLEITDTWWRINVGTVGGTLPSYSLIASFSVSPKLT